MLDYAIYSYPDHNVKTEDVIKYFGSQAKVAKVLGITKQAVSSWGDTVPLGRAYQIQAVTGGELKAENTVAA